MKALVIGTGFGARVMAPVYEQLGLACTVVSPHDDAVVRAAIAEPVDLVSIHSPPFMHHDHVMAAIDAGRAVLCDKPFGRNVTEARAMRDRAHQAGVLNFLNFEFRRQPARVRLKQMLDQGAIGTLVHVQWSVIGAGLRDRRHGWLFDAEQGGGWLGAFGSHVIDSLRWLTGGEIVRCGGLARTEIRERADRQGVMRRSTAEDALSAWMVTDNGVSVSFDTAYGAPVFLPQRLVLTGSEAVIEVLDEAEIVLRRPGAEPETITLDPPAPEADPHFPAILPWLTQVRDALRDGRQIAPSFDDGVACAEVMDALRAQMIRAD